MVGTLRKFLPAVAGSSPGNALKITYTKRTFFPELQEEMVVRIAQDEE